MGRFVYWRMTLLMFAATIAVADVGANRSLAQSPDGQRPEVQRPETPIRLDTLPDAPPEIAKLIREGSVKLITGGEPLSDLGTLPSGIRLAGETRFTFRYHYDSRATWQNTPRNSRDPEGESMMLLRVTFRAVKLNSSHIIWLRQPKSPDRFWDDPVVQHEFDHVRISSDPRIEDLFLKSAQSMKLMRVPSSQLRGSSGRIHSQSVQAFIESQMKSALTDASDYANIRYKELDRLTEHGMKPLPVDAESDINGTREAPGRRESLPR